MKKVEEKYLKTLIDKDIDSVILKLQELKLEFRVYQENGLLTADFRPDRITVGYSAETRKVIDCWYG